ncbi:MAG: hypothetical protein NDI61_08770, partial [Bdellovibrionaceae bacterium]|nr:hypothetical protein [Pseudobdellovibrionaceae bacterium]
MKHVGQKIRNSLVLTGLICLSPSLGLAESLACSSAFRALEQTLPPASQVLDAQSLAKANQGRDTLIDFVRQIGLKDLEKGFEVILESGIAPDQATGNLDVTFKVQFTN